MLIFFALQTDSSFYIRQRYRLNIPKDILWSRFGKNLNDNDELGPGT